MLLQRHHTNVNSVLIFRVNRFAWKFSMWKSGRKLRTTDQATANLHVGV